jgi:predicted RNA methylase
MSVRNTVKSIQDIMRQDTGVDGDAQRISQLCWMFFLKIIDDQDQELEVLNADYRSPIADRFQWRMWAADPEGITGDTLMMFVNNELFPALKALPSPGAGNRSRVVRDVFEDAYNYMKSGQLMRQVINKINEIDFNNLAEKQHFGEIYEQILNDLQSAGNAGEYYTPRAVTAFMAERIDPRPGEILLDPACGTGGFLTCSLRHMRERYVKTVEDEERMQQALRAVEKKQLPHMLCVTNMLLHGIHDPSFVRHDNTLARPYISYGAADRVDIVLTNPPFGGREEDGIESNFPKRFQTRETAEEPASELIRRIRTERARLVEKVRLRKQQRLEHPNPPLPTAAGKTPATIPDSWEWVRVADALLVDSQNGYSKKPDDALDGIPILRISAGTVRKDGIVAEEQHKLIGGISAAVRDQYELQPGDLLACRFNGNRNFVGRLSLYLGYLGIKPIYPDKLIRLRLLSQFVLPTLVRYFSEASVVRKDVETYSATTVGNWGISASNLKKVMIPLPPLAEQHRIVAKVDELMAVCDRLEAQLTIAQTERRRLLEAVLHDALASAVQELGRCGQRTARSPTMR